MYSLRVIVPVFPKNVSIYFRGNISVSEKYEVVISITEFSTSFERLVHYKNTRDDVIYGIYSNQSSGKKTLSPNYLVLEQCESLRVKKLIIDRKRIHSIDDCIIMLYDYYRMNNSETMFDSAEFLTSIQKLVQNNTYLLQEQVSEPEVSNTPHWLATSMSIQHLFNYFNLINWLWHSIKKQKKISIKQGNVILAILIDIIIGYVVLNLLTHSTEETSSVLMGILEKLVNFLYSLLKWLMGAPAGLKLNNAFNKMLGKYFSYHIQLWWQFLEVSGEKLDVILSLYHYLGYLGFTFQAAMISDMICVATFHSYCIYVYAARLFNIQISGLIALLRLFVGRKYNPLRNGIDSCEYTNQELFVGTVAFTILLLLLPTTAMYYIVFTLFRLLSLIVQYILTKLIYIIQTLPLYVVTLWIIRSPKVAGKLLIDVVNNYENSPLVLKVNLFNKPLTDLVKQFQPPVKMCKQFEWTNLLSNILVGKQII